MEHYVTLFDKFFLPQGLALHISMERHAGSYTLWILCVDDETFEVLQCCNLPNVSLLQLRKYETNELITVKHTRTKGEYCWTLAPFAPRFVFETDLSVNRVTYIDADMWLRKNPAYIFFELDLSGKQVLITDHAYAPEYDQFATSGQYCVQFMSFLRDGGELVRKWWEERCIEWCFARLENGKFGDQKYLDDWPERFPEYVHVLQHQEWMLAPWNSTRFPYSGAVFHHFHGLRIVDEKTYVLNNYVVPKKVFDYIYKPYMVDLRTACELLQNVGMKIPKQHNMIRRSCLEVVKDWIIGFLRIQRQYETRRAYKWE